VGTFETLRQQLDALPQMDGVSPVDLLELPPTLQVAVRRMLRSGLTLRELADVLGLPTEQAAQIGDMLVEKGMAICEEIDHDGGTRYRICTARTRGRQVPLDL
jgi:hypothetical protein